MECLEHWLVRKCVHTYLCTSYIRRESPTRNVYIYLIYTHRWRRKELNADDDDDGRPIEAGGVVSCRVEPGEMAAFRRAIHPAWSYVHMYSM